MASLPQEFTTKIHSQNPRICKPTPLRRLQPARFRRSDQVEVASEQEGFVGSYYEATIVADLVEHGYVVQYRTLVKDDFSAPLREVAAAAEVRPRPPAIFTGGYRAGDVVDAFDNDGWWWGRITGRRNDDYVVFFETTRDEIAYSKDRIRVHQDWINGKWIHASNLLPSKRRYEFDL